MSEFKLVTNINDLPKQVRMPIFSRFYFRHGFRGILYNDKIISYVGFNPFGQSCSVKTISNQPYTAAARTTFKEEYGVTCAQYLCEQLIRDGYKKFSGILTKDGLKFINKLKPLGVSVETNKFAKSIITVSDRMIALANSRKALVDPIQSPRSICPVKRTSSLRYHWKKILRK